MTQRGEQLKLFGRKKETLWMPDKSVDPLQFITEQLPKDGISKYLIDTHGQLIEGANFAVWQSCPEDKDIRDSVIMKRYNRFVEVVDGIEIIFGNFISNLFGDPRNDLHGRPMFVYKNKWVGLIYYSEEKGMSIKLDQKRSTLEERMSVFGSFIQCCAILRGIAQGKGYDLTSKTKTKEHWVMMLRTFEHNMRNGDIITTVSPLFLGMK